MKYSPFSYDLPTLTENKCFLVTGVVIIFRTFYMVMRMQHNWNTLTGTFQSGTPYTLFQVKCTKPFTISPRWQWRVQFSNLFLSRCLQKGKYPPQKALIFQPSPWLMLWWCSLQELAPKRSSVSLKVSDYHWVFHLYRTTNTTVIRWWKNMLSLQLLLKPHTWWTCIVV